MKKLVLRTYFYENKTRTIALRKPEFPQMLLFDLEIN